MRTRYDPEVDALIVQFADVAVHDSEEISPGIIVDYDDANRIVGIEVLHAQRKLTPSALPSAA